MFFVAGITGNVGGAAAQLLLAQGHSLRTLARNPQKAAAFADQGVEVLPGDLSDPAALTAALHGVDGAFLLVPPLIAPAPGFPETKAVLVSYTEALKKSPPRHLVALSSVGSEQPDKLGLITSTHLLEEALANLPLPTAFIRAGSFLENYSAGIQAAAASGILYSFYQPLDRPVPTVAAADIGAEVARLLTDASWTENGTKKKVIELGSPVTPNQIAHALGEALGRPVQAQAVPRDRWAGTLESFGLPPGSTGPYEEMIDSINSGWIHFGVPGTDPIPATITPARFFAEVAKP